MSLPKPIALQTINGLKSDAMNYESHKSTITAYNRLIASLGPGNSIKPQNFSLPSGLGSGAAISALSGSFKRGSFTVTIGSAGLTANPVIALNFPTGTFAETPFALVARNGGTGTLNFTYTTTVHQLAITLVGTPTAGHVYSFNFAVTE